MSSSSHPPFLDLESSDYPSRRVFAKAGYRVAIIARRAEGVNTVADDIKKAGGEVCLDYPSMSPQPIILHVRHYRS